MEILRKAEIQHKSENQRWTFYKITTYSWKMIYSKQKNQEIVWKYHKQPNSRTRNKIYGAIFTNLLFYIMYFYLRRWLFYFHL